MEFDSEDVLQFMTSASSYQDHPTSVRIVETHISWVFLTDRYAYKLKKPVRFDFLDFSTVALRRKACEDELRLNRRLAPTVYIDVLPVVQNSDGSLEMGGNGIEVDWVVQMRRLPDDKALDVMLRKGRLTPENERTVAQHLTALYAQLAPEPLTPNTYWEALERHISANRAALVSALPEARARVLGVNSLQLRFLHVERDVIDRRVIAGRIVDGHGDLRPEHIYLENPPVVIDCIEFSDEMRQVDVADELSFLAMECQRLGNSSLGELVLATYQRVCGDDIPPRLLHFYRCYRACVRAKVAMLRERQLTETGQKPHGLLGRHYVDLAEQDASELGAPCVLIVGGLIGTGKSTLAHRIAIAFGAELLSTDTIRHTLIGSSRSPAGYGKGNYRPELRSQIYEELFARVDGLLNDKLSAILDGTFLTRKHRKRVYDLCARHGAVCLFVLCECDRQTALAHIQERSQMGESESEAHMEFYDLQSRDFELPQEDEPTVRVDTTQTMPQQLHAVYSELRRMLFG